MVGLPCRGFNHSRCSTIAVVMRHWDALTAASGGGCEELDKEASEQVDYLLEE